MIRLALALLSVAAAPAPEAILDLVARLDRAQPITAAAIGRLLDVSVTCSTNGPRRDCSGGPFSRGGVTVTDIDFRSTPSLRQSLLIFGGLQGDCVSIGAIEARFGAGEPIVGCAGRGCFYRRIQRPWGSISAGQGDDSQAICATRIILNSYADH